MQTKSRDGKFMISAPDTAKTLRMYKNFPREDDYEECIDVNITAIEGCNPTLGDLSSTIENDCFVWDSLGLQLLAKALHCVVTVGEKKYEFKIDRCFSPDDYLQSLANQLIL